MIVCGLAAYREEESEEDGKDDVTHGHVNSISVLRSYRRLGLAKKLMLRSREYIAPLSHSSCSTEMCDCSEEAMASVYKAAYVSLHVRKSNKAAIGLYRDTLGFEVAKVVKKYCECRHLVIERWLYESCVDGDGEDALSMRLKLGTETS